MLTIYSRVEPGPRLRVVSLAGVSAPALPPLPPGVRGGDASRPIGADEDWRCPTGWARGAPLCLVKRLDS